MAELTDLFASIDANKITRETDDRIALEDGTLNFTALPEKNNLYFIPEGDPRINDKINYNFNMVVPNYILTDIDYSANANDFIFADTTNLIAREDSLLITAQDNVSYDVTIDSVLYSYTSSVGVAREDSLLITAQDNVSYDVTIDSVLYSYTSSAAVAREDLIDTITVADSTNYEILINGVSALYTSGVGATLAEIVTGLTAAINALVEPVTATDNATNITIIADVAGTDYTVSIVQGIATLTNTVTNSNATVAEIRDGLIAAITAGATPSIGTDVKLTAITAGTDYTLTVSANLTIVNDVANSNATVAEIRDGLIAAITAGATPSIGTDVKLIAITAGTDYTLTVSANLTIVNDVANKVGEITITLPTTPSNYLKITVYDSKYNFATANAILSTTETIMGLVGNYNLTLPKIELIYVDGNWFIL